MNTSFLGRLRSIQVGTVDYSYYQFGPLNVSAANAGSSCSRVWLAINPCPELALPSSNVLSLLSCAIYVMSAFHDPFVN